MKGFYHELYKFMKQQGDDGLKTEAKAGQGIRLD